MDKQERERLRQAAVAVQEADRPGQLLCPSTLNAKFNAEDRLTMAAVPDVLLRLLDAAEQRAALETEQRSRWTRQVAALLGDFDRRDQVRRSVDLDDASLLARAVELLRAMMPLGGQTSEGGGT